MIETNERVRPRPSGSNPKAKSSSSEKGVFLTGMQIVVCVLIIAAALLIKQFGGTLYTQIEPYVKSAINTNINKEDVTGVFKSIGKQLPDAAEIFKNDPTVSSSSVSSANNAASANNSQISTSSQQSSSGASSSQASSSSTTKTTSSPTASKTAQNLCTSGSFKMPKIVYNAVSVKTQAPPETAVYSPIKLSILPVKPVEGRVTSAYGFRKNPVTGKYTFHTGMDIAAAKSTPIKACFAGSVEEAGNNETYGNYVLIDHGNGIKTFYADCEEITAKLGDKVKAGDIVAKVGSTGISTGYHLHFEIRINSKNCNPQWVV